MNQSEVLQAAGQFGGVPITADNRKAVAALLKAGKLDDSPVNIPTGQWAFVPDFPETAYVMEVRVRPDQAAATPDWYTADEQRWRTCDWLGNPVEEARLNLPYLLMDLNPRHFDADVEVRVRRVGTEHAIVVVAGKAPEEVEV